MLKNDLKNLDEFAFFRQQVEKLKQKDLALLQRSVKELPKAKKDFFSHWTPSVMVVIVPAAISALMQSSSPSPR